MHLLDGNLMNPVPSKALVKFKEKTTLLTSRFSDVWACSTGRKTRFACYSTRLVNSDRIDIIKCCSDRRRPQENIIVEPVTCLTVNECSWWIQSLWSYCRTLFDNLLLPVHSELSFDERFIWILMWWFDFRVWAI